MNLIYQKQDKHGIISRIKIIMIVWFNNIYNGVCRNIQVIVVLANCWVGSWLPFTWVVDSLKFG